MRHKLTKITLAASIALAMAFTFGCSDDKDGGWLTCEELSSLVHKCTSNALGELMACNFDNACTNAVEAKIDACVAKDSCNGTSQNECQSYYNETLGCEQ